MNTEDKALFSTVCIGGIQIIIGFIGIIKNNNLILLVNIVLLSITIFCIIYLSKKVHVFNYKYSLIQYLFHNDNVNRFNIVPKLLLLMDQEKKYNHLDIDHVDVTYDITYSNNQYNSKVIWRMRGIHNSKRRDVSEYYFYTGTGIGDCQHQTLTLYKSNASSEYKITNYLERNRIKLLTWSFPTVFTSQSYIKKMDLSLFINGIFDFSMNQVIYFIPRNFGQKLNSFSISINMHFEKPTFDMELREIGCVKGNKGISEHILKSHQIYRNEDNSTTYSFEIEKKYINMDNVYYIFLIPRQ